MIMRSEGEKIKFITTPSRDRKYAIVGFSKFMLDFAQTIPDDVVKNLIRALVELSTTSSMGGF